MVESRNIPFRFGLIASDGHLLDISVGDRDGIAVEVNDVVEFLQIREHLENIAR